MRAVRGAVRVERAFGVWHRMWQTRRNVRRTNWIPEHAHGSSVDEERAVVFYRHRALEAAVDRVELQKVRLSRRDGRDG